jgi:uncharacterized protein
VTVTPSRLGSGWSFPVLPRPVTGDLAFAVGTEKVRESILLVLLTEPGERVMRPSFGCGLRRFLAEPNTVGTRARLVREVTTAIETWEPRVRLREVTADPGEDPSLVLLTIRYEHARDASEGLILLPFSLGG